VVETVGRMKALTIKQPWAELIASGDKRVENRNWRTHYRGDIAVHAGIDRTLCRDLDQGYIDYMDFGAVIAIVEIVDCVQIDDPAALEKYPWLEDDEYAEGPWCWILVDVRRLDEPIKVKGALGLWECAAVRS
jgi:activating signal cointegrator 1